MGIIFVLVVSRPYLPNYKC